MDDQKKRKIKSYFSMAASGGEEAGLQNTNIGIWRKVSGGKGYQNQGSRCDRIVECPKIDGYLTESYEDFKGGNINNLVYAILPILSNFKVKNKKQEHIVSVGKNRSYPSTWFSWRTLCGEQKIVLIIEAKRTSRAGHETDLISRKDMRGVNVKARCMIL
ncbi:hypothetical protein BDZ91DRAFT_789925 [Kalaharituber pfeilii]|nr:hypothetical protein BDZ91DRAFT_789925 [Kalaharituber pfeilii]